MNQTKLSTALWLGFVLIFSGAVLLALPPVAGQAQPTLPPRQTPTPTPIPVRRDKDGPPLGAYIDLIVTGAPAGVWTVVQWQDANGDWQDVAGWRGNLDAGGKRWWVASKDFGTGPFRWTVMQGPEGAVLGSSAPFNLPAEANAVTQVTVSLGP